jgi:hypothetical protein
MAKTVQLREPGSAGGGYPESAGNVSASCRECKKPAIRARLIMAYKYKQGPGALKVYQGLVFLWAKYFVCKIFSIMFTYSDTYKFFI